MLYKRVWCTTQLAKLSFNHSNGRTHSWRFSTFIKNYSLTVRTKSSGWPWHQHQGKPPVYCTYVVHVAINSTPGSWIPADVFRTNDECYPRFAALCRLCCTEFLQNIPRTLFNFNTPEHSWGVGPQTNTTNYYQTTTTTPSGCRSSQLAYQISGDLPS